MTPILYSFRRCPYAMRARLALASTGLKVELREIQLRNKPPAFLEASASGTVPCLVTAEGVVGWQKTKHVRILADWFSYVLLPRRRKADQVTTG
jgi:glutathione S-transferase